jgi:hypothetical protein
VSLLCERIIDMSTNEDDLLFTALCDRFRSPTNIRRTMTREELQRATGLDPEVLDEALKALRGPDAHDGSYIAFEGDKVVLGTVWRTKCQALPRDPAPARSADAGNKAMPAPDRCKRCGKALTRNDFEDECEACRASLEQS